MYVKLNLFFMKRLTLILSCFLLSMSLAIGQNASISGTVVDETGEPVIGASIDVKGDARYGAISDVNGRFSFEAPSSAKTLVVSFIGKRVAFFYCKIHFNPPTSTHTLLLRILHREKWMHQYLKLLEIYLYLILQLNRHHV